MKTPRKSKPKVAPAAVGLGVTATSNTTSVDTPSSAIFIKEAVSDINVTAAVKPSTVENSGSSTVRGAVRRFGNNDSTDSVNTPVIELNGDIKITDPSSINVIGSTLNKGNDTKVEELAPELVSSVAVDESVNKDEPLVTESVKTDNVVNMPKVEEPKADDAKVGESVTLISTGFDSIDTMIKDQKLDDDQTKIVNGAIGLFAGLKLTVSGLIGAGGLAVVGIMLVHMNPFTWVTGIMVLMCMPIIGLTYLCLRSMWNSWVTLKSFEKAVV